MAIPPEPLAEYLPALIPIAIAWNAEEENSPIPPPK